MKKGASVFLDWAESNSRSGVSTAQAGMRILEAAMRIAEVGMHTAQSDMRIAELGTRLACIIGWLVTKRPGRTSFFLSDRTPVILGIARTHLVVLLRGPFGSGALGRMSGSHVLR